MTLAEIITITEENTRVAVNTGTLFFQFVAHDAEDSDLQAEIMQQYGNDKVMNIWVSRVYSAIVFNI